MAAGLATVQLSTPAPNGITEVKYFIFFAIALFSIPSMTCATLTSAKLRGWLLALLIFSTALGDLANINFVSMENYRGPDRGFEVNLTDLITLSLAFALIIKHFKQIKWFPMASAWMAALFVISSISVWQAADPLLGGFTLVKQVKSYVLFWTVVNVVRIGTDKKYIWWGLAGIGVFFSTLVLKQKYLDGIYRISGSFDHSNTVPLFLNLIIPMLLIWGLTDRTLPKWKTFVSIVGALGMVFAVVSTFSRAGTALSVICLIAVLVTANLRARSRRVSAVSLLMLLALLIGGFKAANSFLERIKNAPESSEAARVEFNIAAAKMAKDRWLGVGLNNFSRVLTDTPEYREHFSVMANETQAGVAHHIYWLTAAEIGFSGLAIFLILIGRLALIAAWHGLRSGSFEGNLLIGLFFGFMALHLSGFLEWAMRITPVTYLFYINCGICVGLAGALQTSERARGNANWPKQLAA